MNQYTITFETAQGSRRFAFVDAESYADLYAKVYAAYPKANVLSCRLNDPPLAIITEVKA